MKYRTIIATATALLLTVSLSFLTSDLRAGIYRPVRPIEVTIDAPDSSVELVGYLYLPDQKEYPQPPVVILLHQLGRSHAVWEDFALRQCQQGWAVFAMDLRGHGWSIYDLKRKENRPTGTFHAGDFAQYPNDIRYLVNHMLAKHATDVDTSTLAVIGASIGGNSGLLYAATEPRVKYTALISAGLDYKGLRIANAIFEFTDRPLFLATAARDINSAQSCYLLADFIPRPLDIKVYDTSYHGNELVSRSVALKKKLEDDLKRYLR
ncbi:MAG: alpha/beta fold hydrolase [candidate division Zixibacteria bacterium]|nr:alpha/beta fold hydrolase [candidate division Zixibacteria bacterium]